MMFNQKLKNEKDSMEDEVNEEECGAKQDENENVNIEFEVDAAIITDGRKLFL